MPKITKKNETTKNQKLYVQILLTLNYFISKGVTLDPRLHTHPSALSWGGGHPGPLSKHTLLSPALGGVTQDPHLHTRPAALPWGGGVTLDPRLHTCPAALPWAGGRSSRTPSAHTPSSPALGGGCHLRPPSAHTPSSPAPDAHLCFQALGS